MKLKIILKTIVFLIYLIMDIYVPKLSKVIYLTNNELYIYQLYMPKPNNS
jgi:hypothetical protein